MLSAALCRTNRLLTHKTSNIFPNQLRLLSTGAHNLELIPVHNINNTDNNLNTIPVSDLIF